MATSPADREPGERDVSNRAPRGTRFRPELLAAAAIVASVLLGLPTLSAARPVPIGHFRTLRYGINPQHPWPAAGASGQRRYRVRAHVPMQAPTLVWARNSGIGQVFEPLVAADGRVVLSGVEGALAIDVSNHVHWTHRGGGASGPAALVPSGAVVVLQRHGVVLHVDAVVQHERELSTSGFIGAPLALADGTVVASTGGHELMRFDPETGERRFTVRVPEGVRGAPVEIATELIVVATARGVAFVDGEGAVNAIHLGRGPALGPVVLDDGTVTVVLADGRLVNLDRRGQIRAETTLPHRPSNASNLAIARDGSLRYGAADGTLVALSAGGDPLFARQGRHLHGVMVDAAGTTLTVDASGNLLAIDASGDLRWSAPVSGRAIQAPVLDGEGRIFVVTVAGRIFCYRVPS